MNEYIEWKNENEEKLYDEFLLQHIEEKLFLKITESDMSLDDFVKLEDKFEKFCMAKYDEK